MRMGSSFMSIGDGGPDAILDLGLRVKTAGDDFVDQAQSLAQAIQEIEDQRPWGDGDKYAVAFLKNYAAKPPGSDLPANDAVRKGLGDSGTSLSNIGSTVVETMAKYSATDQGSSTAIDSATRSV
ncbi:MAG TPA: hypothetical protein VGJ07_04950 [Rugosimonospora sp.]